MKNRFLVAIASLFFVACHSNAQNIDANVFEQKLNAGGAQVLDVRTAGEFIGGHLKNVLQADWTDREQFVERTKHLDKNKTLLIYCASGIRSAQAAAFLKQEGFREVINLQGGIAAWNAAGKPVVRQEGVAELTSTTFNATVANNQIVLVDVGAEWCPPCKKMEPVLESLSKEFQGKFTLLKVDGGRDLTVMKEIGASVLPTFMVYKNGKLSWKKEGIVTLQELKDALNN
ncbi:MAG: thioredoxin domain-containing protein [Sediminibacterium sp.]|nr:thioredoxin domain-containing protein [Sediminibacterium sp.]